MAHNTKHTISIFFLICFVLVTIESSYSLAAGNENVPGNYFQGNVPDGTGMRFSFENENTVQIASNTSLNLSVDIDEAVQSRFLGLVVNSSDSMELNVNFQGTFSQPPQNRIRVGNPSRSPFTNQIPTQINENDREIFMNRPSTEESELEINYNYNTYFELDLDGDWSEITVYSLLTTELDLNPNLNYCWAIYDNSSSEWYVLNTEIEQNTQVEGYEENQITTTTITNEGQDQLILTIVEIPTPTSFIESDSGKIFLGVVAAVAILFGLMMTKQEYRDYLLNRFLPLSTGPHRLTMEEVLENENRNEIINAIIDIPGIHFNELLREIGISAGTLAWHLDILETFKVIRKQRVGQYLIYYPYLDKNPISRLDPKLQKSRTTLEILQLIDDNPGMFQGQIAKRMDLDHKTVKYHVDKLMEAEIITTKKKGRKMLYFPTEIMEEFREKYFDGE